MRRRASTSWSSGRDEWVTKADPEGSEEALKADSQSCDEGSAVWKQRR